MILGQPFEASLLNLLRYRDPSSVLCQASNNLVPYTLHLGSVENALDVSPPGTLGTALCALDQRLLHTVGEFPPFLDCLVLAHALHVVCEAVADVDECCEEEVGFWVVKDVVCLELATTLNVWDWDICDNLQSLIPLFLICFNTSGQTAA